MFKHLPLRGGICDAHNNWPHLAPLIQQGRFSTHGLFRHDFSLSDGPVSYRLFDSRHENVLKPNITAD